MLESTQYLVAPLPTTWTNQRVVDWPRHAPKDHVVVLTDLDAHETIEFVLRQRPRRESSPWCA
jgi:hypothetical protein